MELPFSCILLHPLCMQHGSLEKLSTISCTGPFWQFKISLLYIFQTIYRRPLTWRTMSETDSLASPLIAFHLIVRYKWIMVSASLGSRVLDHRTKASSFQTTISCSLVLSRCTVYWLLLWWVTFRPCYTWKEWNSQSVVFWGKNGHSLGFIMSVIISSLKSPCIDKFVFARSACFNSVSPWKR